MPQETISKTKLCSPVLGNLSGSLLVSCPGGHLLAQVEQVVKVLRGRHLYYFCTSSLPYTASKTSLLFQFVLVLFLVLRGRCLILFPLHILQWTTLCLLVLYGGGREAGSFSAIYNIHLGRHPDIPKLFRPPLSRPVPHILCLLLTLQRLCQRIPQPRLSFQVCFAPPSHRQNAFLFLSQHSPPHSRHLPGQVA